jgi:ornithine lipid ester-linked acyl 2-hydroxylase
LLAFAIVSLRSREDGPGVVDACFGFMLPLGRRFAERRRQWIKDFGCKALWSFERTIAAHSQIGDDALPDRRCFPWIADLERHAPSMRRELDALLVHRDALPSFHEISPDQRSITSDDRWKTYFLHAFGKRSRNNCIRCPITAAVLSRIPNITTAFFSILAPGKHIPKHRGVYKGLVRAHLGLKVPERSAECRMEIAGQTVNWREGEAFVFDDTYEHEVWNESAGERVVLLIDVLRPLPTSIQLLNRALIRAVAASPYVTDGEKNELEWERKFDRAMALAGDPLAVSGQTA